MTTQTHAAQTPMQVNFDELTTLLQQAHDMPRPLMIWGAPGVGKTECVEQAFPRTTPLYAAYMERTDLNGWPVPDHSTKRTNYYMLDYLPMAETEDPSSETHCLFLDELSNATRDTATAFLELVNKRTIKSKPPAPNTGFVVWHGLLVGRAGPGTACQQAVPRDRDISRLTGFARQAIWC